MMLASPTHSHGKYLGCYYVRDPDLAATSLKVVVTTL